MEQTAVATYFNMKTDTDSVNKEAKLQVRQSVSIKQLMGQIWLIGFAVLN